MQVYTCIQVFCIKKKNMQLRIHAGLLYGYVLGSIEFRDDPSFFSHCGFLKCALSHTVHTRYYVANSSKATTKNQRKKRKKYISVRTLEIWNNTPRYQILSPKKVQSYLIFLLFSTIYVDHIRPKVLRRHCILFKISHSDDEWTCREINHNFWRRIDMASLFVFCFFFLYSRPGAVILPDKVYVIYDLIITFWWMKL